MVEGWCRERLVDNISGCRAERNDPLAQRIGDPLFVGPSRTGFAQGLDRFGRAEDQRDLAKPGEAASAWHGLKSPGDKGGCRQRTAAQQQLSDAGQETLQPAVGRAPSLREPDLHIARFQHPSSAFEHGAGTVCLDWIDIYGPAEEARERV